MSAIVAGQMCRICGKEHWTSFGHPDWFKKREGELWKGFLSFRSSGLCATCWITCISERPAESVSSGEVGIAMMISETLDEIARRR